jgi:hypothetical protein
VRRVAQERKYEMMKIKREQTNKKKKKITTTTTTTKMEFQTKKLTQNKKKSHSESNLPRGPNCCGI